MTCNRTAKLRKALEAGAAPGCAVVVTCKGRELFRFADGIHDHKSRRVVTEDTLFDIASITKLFTAAIVLRLWEAGRIEIGDRCSKYLDIFAGSRLRVIDLLTHQVAFDTQLKHLRESGAAFAEEVFRIRPPVNVSPITYGNVGYLYLGHLIEVVSGRKFGDCVAVLCQELGLSGIVTGSNRSLDTPPTSPDDLSGSTHDESARLLGGVAGHAGVFASARGLTQFGESWLSGRVVDESVLKEIVFRNYDRTGRTPQGLGWWRRIPKVSGDTPGCYSHTGYTGCLLAVEPDSGCVRACVCNRTYYGPDNDQHRDLWRILLDSSLDSWR